MSAEHFQTFLTADMRTAPDGRSGEYAESMSQHPRAFARGVDGELMFSDREHGWASGYLYAHTAMTDIIAPAVEQDIMEGITGDHPEMRQQAADLIRAVAFAVRELALDAAGDGSMDAARWETALAKVRDAAEPREP